MTKNRLYDDAAVLDQVKKTVAEYHMIQPGDKVLVGVSGGPDSVALIRILNNLKKNMGFDMGIAHVNHGLRGDTAKRDEQFVRALAKEMAVPCYVTSEDVKKYSNDNKLSIEHGGRRIRYAYFYRILTQFGFTKIALGHNADDNAEVVLMALLRGSGPLGLSGIPPVRDHVIIRPLIHLTRSQIEHFLHHHKWPYVIDETNQKPDHLRNRIRLELMPLLEKDYNPKIVQNLNRVSDILRHENAGMEKRTSDLIASTVWEDLTETGETRCSFFISNVRHLYKSQQRRFIRAVIKKVKGDLKRLTFDHIEAVLGVMSQDQSTKEIHLPDNILVSKISDQLSITQKANSLRHLKKPFQPGHKEDYTYYIDDFGRFRIDAINRVMMFSQVDRENMPNISSAGQKIAFFDIKKAKFPMILRNFNARDRFIPLGMTGSKRVTHYLKDRKVAPISRLNIPVLVVDGQVAWVVGHRIDDRFKVTDKTEKIVKVEIQRLDERDAL